LGTHIFDKNAAETMRHKDDRTIRLEKSSSREMFQPAGRDRTTAYGVDTFVHKVAEQVLRMVVNARPVDVDRIEEVELRRFGLVSVSQDSSIGYVGWEQIFRPKDGVLVGTILVQDPQPRLRGL
jgi:hypothetical protein